MFSLFKKKTIPAYPNESKWNLSIGSHEGQKMVLRRNESAASLIGHADYGYRVGFAVPLLNPDEDGMPGPEENLVLDEIEDALAESIEAEQNGLLVSIITTSGMKEFMFYTRKPENIEALAATVKLGFSKHDIQFYIAVDKNWDGYKQLS